MKTTEDLRDYQLDALSFLEEGDSAMLWMDVGAGKTVTVLTYLNYADQWPALIVAPKRVCESVWSQEAEQWAHLKGLAFSKVLGTATERANALENDANIYLINYENLPWFSNRYDKKGKDFPFKAIVFDEVSKMKGRGKWYKCMRPLAKHCDIRIGMTGTPQGNSLLGLYGQYGAINEHSLLGGSFEQFKRKYFYPTDFMQYDWQPFPSAREQILAAVESITFEAPSPDFQKDPLEVDVAVPMTDALEYRYREFKRMMLDDPTATEAVNAGVLVNKLRQLASGWLYNEDSTYEISDVKLPVVTEIVGELQGEPVLIFYDFVFQKKELVALYGESALLSTDEDIKRWNAGEMPVAIAHPASAGHGLNIQFGGHHMIFMSAPWSSELYQQAVGRLHRPGQKHRVIVHRLVTQGTVDEDVVDLLSRNLDDEQVLKTILNRLKVEGEE